MGGLNSLSGLNKINVDFRPTVELIESKPDKSAGEGLGQVEGAISQAPAKAEAKSVVQQLDVLLLNAARKSIGTDIVKNFGDVSKSLETAGILDEDKIEKLNELANNAAEALKALDKFSGMELANALTKKTVEVEDWSKATVEQMRDKNYTPETKKKEVIDWSTNRYGLTDVAKAVTAAIDAQMKLSNALGELNEVLASSGAVDAALQDKFTEMQFQCDRRASEIDSLVFRMFDLAQKNVVDGKIADTQIKALLDSTFMELMPREAIMMHGTAEALEKVRNMFSPLASKLDDFTKNSTKMLNKNDIRDLEAKMATMKNAIANVRKNGIDETTFTYRGKNVTKRTEVDKSLLDAMDKILDDAKIQLDNLKKTTVKRTVDAFIKEVKDSLYPEELPGAPKVYFNSSLDDYKQWRGIVIKAMDDFASGKIGANQFYGSINNNHYLIRDLNVTTLEQSYGEKSIAKGIKKTIDGFGIIKEQFVKLMKSAQKQDEITTSDVRRIMLGEVGVSNIIEAKVRGFKPSDVDSATEEMNIVSSKELGSGEAGKTYLLKTQNGGELVFKPDIDSRIGLEQLNLSDGKAYKYTQNTANLNLATQDTAKAFGCEDLFVKYSVGSHNGQFGVFMEKAKGFTGEEISQKEKSEGDGIAPTELKDIDPLERAKIKGQIAQKLNKLMWLDLITGQGDRHWNNYFVHIDKETHDVTLKAIDNDASFNERQIGLQKYNLTRSLAEDFESQLHDKCNTVGIFIQADGKTEYNNRVSKDPAIKRNSDGSMTVDLSKAQSPEVKIALDEILATQSIAIPEEIDKGFCDQLMKMAKGSRERKDLLNSLKPRLTPEALKATEKRLDEAIAHAKKLEKNGKVYGDDKWKDPDTLSQLPAIKNKIEVKKSDGTNVTVETGSFGLFQVHDCPSYFTRDFFDKMF